MRFKQVWLSNLFEITHLHTFFLFLNVQGRRRRYGRYGHGRRSLFGPIMIFKISHFEFSFPLFYYFLSFFLQSNRNKIEKLLYLDFHNQTDNLDFQQVATEFFPSRERRQCVLGAFNNLNIINSSTHVDLYLGSLMKHFPKLLKVELMAFDFVVPLLQRVSCVYFCLLKYCHVV